MDLSVFTNNAIISEVGHVIFSRGLNYYNLKRVQIVENTPDLIKAKVRGSYIYNVEIKADRSRVVVDCNCPYYGFCKHIVAVILSIRHINHVENTPIPVWKNLLEDDPSEIEQEQGKLIFLITTDEHKWSLESSYHYVKKTGALGRQLKLSEWQINAGEINATTAEKIAVKYINNNHYSYFESPRQGLEFGCDMGHLLELITESHILDGDDQDAQITFYPHPVNLKFDLVKKDNGYSLSLFLVDDQKLLLPVNNKMKLLTGGKVFFLKDRRIYRVSQQLSSKQLRPFTQVSESIIIPGNEFPEYMEKLYPRLISCKAEISLPEGVAFSELEEITGRILYLREEKGELKASLSFEYSGHEIGGDADQRLPVSIIRKGGIYYQINRQLKVEEYWKHKLEDYGFFVGFSTHTLLKKINPMDWLFDTLPEIAEAGYKIFGEENLKSLKVRRGTPRLVSKVSSGEDWFDLQVEIDIEGLRVSYFEIMKALKKSKKYVRLNDGSAIRLNDAILEKLGFVEAFADKDAKENSLRMEKTQALLLEQFVDQSEDARTDKSFKESIKRLKSFDKIDPVALAPNFKGKLRAYQKAGLDWLGFLKKYDLNGCLADDMGLGKTVQALAMLQLVCKTGKRVNLVVAPTSVITNWKMEAARFTPELKVLIHSGQERADDIAVFKKYDIIVTSYALLWRDFDLLRTVRFHYIILDESQKIKNPDSLTAKCAAGLKANHRLVMTGTPLENNLSELWSQFDFLNPGMLGRLKSYQSYYGKEIELNGNTVRAEELRRIIYPFILRRTKEKVAKELPPKVENILFCEMDATQTKVYDYWRDFYRYALLEQIDKEGLNRSKIQVLAGLTKLRQISIHPFMVDETYQHSSAKFDALQDALVDIFGEGHKVLIFSQFVKALSLVRNKFDDDHVNYAYLDGHTRKRQEQIDRFQNDSEVRAFLISLKAGGTGLNLTAADYVIHLDPWWNPAVESQATDRAHRIGQAKKVFVYKMITRNTVEEKILHMQERKQKLARDIVSTDVAFFKSLNRGDIEKLFT